MGSDLAPEPEIEGALAALSDIPELRLTLVGQQDKLRAALKGRGGDRISITHAPEVITMDDSPLRAVRQKKNASMLVALRLLKKGEADGFVTAGNTGAMMIASRTVLRSIEGVARSALCQLLPALGKPALLLDLGANVDCTAMHLCQFAEMGMVYAQDVLGRDNPRVGLLNIGSEQLKGTDLVKEVHQRLSQAEHINFVGNVEPKSVYKGEADVVVCDGYIGNFVLKTSEAAALHIATQVRYQMSQDLISKIGGLLSLGAMKRLKKTIDPNEYLGAPLLGVRGIVIKQHGGTNALGITNALHGAVRAVNSNVTDHIRDGIAEMRSPQLN
jgi:glycerol-3-phosphate acyltransferase PlsX